MPLFYIKSAPTALGDFRSSIGESDWSQASWRHPWTPLVGFDVAAEPLQALFGISWLGAKFLLRLCTWLHIFNNGRIKLPWRYRYKSVHVRANSTIGIAEHGKHRQPSCNYQRERGGRCFSCGKGWLVSIDSISRLRKNIYRNLRAPGIYSLHLSLLGSAVPATKGYVGRDAGSVGLDNKKKDVGHRAYIVIWITQSIVSCTEGYAQSCFFIYFSLHCECCFCERAPFITRCMPR